MSYFMQYKNIAHRQNVKYELISLSIDSINHYILIYIDSYLCK